VVLVELRPGAPGVMLDAGGLVACRQRRVRRAVIFDTRGQQRLMGRPVGKVRAWEVGPWK